MHRYLGTYIHGTQKLAKRKGKPSGHAFMTTYSTYYHQPDGPTTSCTGGRWWCWGALQARWWCCCLCCCFWLFDPGTRVAPRAQSLKEAPKVEALETVL